MKYLILSLLINILLSLSAYSQSKISVIMANGDILDCSKSISLPAACSDNKGNRYLIDAAERFASAIVISKDGSITSKMQIKQVKNNGNLIYKSFDFPGGGFKGNDEQLYESSHREDEMDAQNVKNGLNFISDRVVDPEAEKLFKELQLANFDRITKIEKIVNSKSIEVEIHDGEKATCKKIDAVKGFTCSISKCEAPLAGYLVEGGFNKSSVFRMDENNNFLDVLDTEKIWSLEDKSKPLFANTNHFLSGYGDPSSGSPQQIEIEKRKREQEEIQYNRSIPKLELQSPNVVRVFTDPMSSTQLKYIMKSCDPKEVSKMLEGVNSLRQSIADAQMVQLVEVTNNILTSRFINPDAIPENACRDGDTYYRESSYEDSRDILQTLAPATIDLDTANKLFEQAKGMKDIAWDYKKDGCYARAHLMARRFEKQGIKVDKVWIKGDLNVPEANISWNFHVAPVVYVEGKSGEVIPMVLDPSLMDGPVTVDAWSAKMKKGVLGETVTTQYPFPENAAATERTAIAFSNSDPYLPYEKIEMSEEEKLKKSNETMVRYLGYSK